ncbi:hypothetical protein ACFE04_029899 [Oxalis oulophora]
MAEEMKVVIVNREIIKPSSPTPPNLKTYNLSFFDQIAPNLYVSVLLFYPFDKDHTLYDDEIDKKSKKLKSSLSKTLTRFYPFAGRIKDNVSIECNDEGAIFIEARVHGNLDLVDLEKSGYSIISKNLQLINFEEQEKRNHLLQVQANFFESGGLVISLSMSHKLADASTVCTFINAWSATALNYPDDVDPVCFADFSLPSILPAVKPSRVPKFKLSIDQSKLTGKRYVFNSAKMSLLKEKAISEGVKKPTRVECVCSLLWKCLMTATRSRLGIETPSIFIQVVNLRRRTIPPLPSNSVGNMLTTFIASREETKITNLNDLILNLRRGLHEIAHFGWGKPTWVCPYMPPFKNLFMLMDTRDGHGIEALCSLTEDYVALLEQDEEFLKFVQT